jgi:hypothetical protein
MLQLRRLGRRRAARRAHLLFRERLQRLVVYMRGLDPEDIVSVEIKLEPGGAE